MKGMYPNEYEAITLLDKNKIKRNTWETTKQEIISRHFANCPQLRRYTVSVVKTGMKYSFGRVRFSDKTIKLKETGDKEQMINSLKHELIHAYLFEEGENYHHTVKFWRILRQIGFIPKHSLFYSKAKQVCNERGLTQK